jgi:eukaryotic-like serine/threonine-protein kinase
VLDFGLAKAWTGASDHLSGSAPDLSQSPTLAHTGTAAGLILGTAAYMSPEQARGKPVDKRTDVWAFGALLYEMLTGTRLFAGETVSDVLAAVLTREPDWAALPASTPAPVRRLVARCLDRDPRKRLRDIGEARLLLEEPLAAEVAPSVSPGRPLAGRIGWAVASLLAVAVATLGGRALAPAPRPPLLRFTISSASGAAIDAGAGSSAISPDGRRVVFVGTDTEGKQGLWIQELDQVRARLLPGTEGASYPFWAPDSRRVAYFAKGRLLKMSLADGRVEAICEAMEARGGSWGRDGTIVFAPSVYGVLSAVSEGGGTPTPATRIENPKEEISHRFPAFLPDGRRFLYVADPGGGIEEGRVYLASLEGGERRFLYRSRRAPVYAEPGYLIDAIDDRLVARPFDPEAGEVRGEPRRLEEAAPPYVHTQDRAASLSDSGALLVPLVEDVGTKVLWLDRRGRLVGEVPLPRGTFVSPRLSPDGRRLAISSQGPKDSESDLWVVDLASEQAGRLTFAPGHERYPVWSPDGRSLAFQTDRGGAFDIWIRPSSGSGAERALHESATAWKTPRSWVGGTLAFETAEAETGFDVWLLLLDRPGEPPVHLLQSAASEVSAAVSPDGRWLAFASNESGRSEVYVVSLPDAKVKHQVTTQGGRHPVWTRGGRELLFLTAGYSVAAVPVTLGESLTFGTPTTLFPHPRPSWGVAADEVLFDVTADGSRFVVLGPERQGSQTLLVVSDWLSELGTQGGTR